MLYQMDMSGVEAESAVRLFWTTLSPTEEVDDFANELVRGFAAHQTRVDDIIRSVSENWRLERMARVDRNIIRLAVHELLTVQEVPRRVTLNEAVELAKRFGDESSPSFVNGVLDRIAADIDKE